LFDTPRIPSESVQDPVLTGSGSGLGPAAGTSRMGRPRLLRTGWFGRPPIVPVRWWAIHRRPSVPAMRGWRFRMTSGRPAQEDEVRPAARFRVAILTPRAHARGAFVVSRPW